MTVRAAETSPQVYARLAGGLYLIVIVAGAFAEGFVRGRLRIDGDAAATARNILAHEMLFRSGFVAGLVVTLCNVPMAVLFYALFKVVNRTVAALVLFFIITATAMESINLLNEFTPLILLTGGRALSAFNAEQLQALAYMSLRAQDAGFNIALTFFALYDLSIGYLVYRSTFMPRAVGVLMAIAGLCYLINSFANFIAPAFARELFPYILFPCALGEASLCLWLLAFGVNAQNWEMQAARPAALITSG